MTGRLRRGPQGANLIWPTVATLAALAILLGLGAWQWSRKSWKEELLATIKARSSAAPISLPELLARNCKPVDSVGSANGCDYTPVRVRGSFDHANERYVFTAIDRRSGSVGGPGYWIMTPFSVPGRNLVLAVNRGFVPEARKSVDTRQQSQSAGDVELVGLVRRSELRSTFTGANAPAKNVWYLRSPKELFATGGGISPQAFDFYIELMSPIPPGGLPQPTVGRIAIPNRHLEYALTWWALGLTLIGVYAAFVWSRLNP